MAHPRYRIVEEGEPLPQTLTPIYPTTAGLSQAELRARVLEALGRTAGRYAAAALRRRLILPDFRASIGLLHRPQPGSDLSGAWRRMKFDETPRTAALDALRLPAAPIAPGRPY